MVFTLGLRHTFLVWRRGLDLIESLVVQTRSLRLRRCRKNLPLWDTSRGTAARHARGNRTSWRITRTHQVGCSRGESRIRPVLPWETDRIISKPSTNGFPDSKSLKTRNVQLSRFQVTVNFLPTTCLRARFLHRRSPPLNVCRKAATFALRFLLLRSACYHSSGTNGHPSIGMLFF